MKKRIRLTESDLKNIINRIVEQVKYEQETNEVVNVGAEVLKRALFPDSDSSETPNVTTNTGTTQNTEEKKVINWANKYKIFNGSWSRKDKFIKEIDLKYKDKSGKEQFLSKIPKPNNVNRIEGTWEVKNNQLIIK